MTTKADFDAVEWATISEAPAIAGLIVITSQRGGTVRESLAMGKAYAEAARDHSGDLIGAIASSAPTISPKDFSSVEDLHTTGLARIGEAVALVESKTSADELEAYRAFAMSVAEHAAEADKSGGFLGIGGERVTDKETIALDQVAGALGTQRTPPDPPSSD